MMPIYMTITSTTRLIDKKTFHFGPILRIFVFAFITDRNYCGFFMTDGDRRVPKRLRNWFLMAIQWRPR